MSIWESRTLQGSAAKRRTCCPGAGAQALVSLGELRFHPERAGEGHWAEAPFGALSFPLRKPRAVPGQVLRSQYPWLELEDMGSAQDHQHRHSWPCRARRLLTSGSPPTATGLLWGRGHLSLREVRKSLPGPRDATLPKRQQGGASIFIPHGPPIWTPSKCQLQGWVTDPHGHMSLAWCRRLAQTLLELTQDGMRAGKSWTRSFQRAETACMCLTSGPGTLPQGLAQSSPWSILADSNCMVSSPPAVHRLARGSPASLSFILSDQTLLAWGSGTARPSMGGEARAPRQVRQWTHSTPHQASSIFLRAGSKPQRSPVLRGKWPVARANHFYRGKHNPHQGFLTLEAKPRFIVKNA